MSRTPFEIPIHDLARQPGAGKELAASIPAPAGIATDVLAIPEGEPLRLDLRLEAVSDGVYVHGEIHANVVGDCVRCLELIIREMTFPVEDLYLYPEAAARAADDGDEEAADMFTTDGDTLDLAPLVRDSIITAFPFTPLCRDDCLGLCPTCGIRMDEAEPDHAHESIDPRLAVLASLLPGSDHLPGTDISELNSIPDGVPPVPADRTSQDDAPSDGTSS